MSSTLQLTASRLVGMQGRKVEKGQNRFETLCSSPVVVCDDFLVIFRSWLRRDCRIWDCFLFWFVIEID